MVNHGIWQSRSMFPVLFNMYFDELIAQWILNDDCNFTILITGNVKYDHSSA
jgi:hypothetical protein